MLVSLRLLFMVVFFISLFLLVPGAQADEGMWLFNNPPREYLKKTYDFEPTEKWLDHVQKSSVRFNSGGSGSFVSGNGLVLTNHHVGADALQKMGTKEHNYYRDGFHARSLAEEQKCEAIEVNVLSSIRDVTAEVNAAVKPGMSAEEAFKARRKVMADIEKSDLGDKDQKKYRSDIVTLYAGALYHLYHYRKYTDVRLVFAPEQQIAFYGGDPDNFEYPRFDLDMCIFRVYDEGKPIHPEHFLTWSKNGAREGELVFVSGHPGRTSRMNTVEELDYLRDTGVPFVLQRLNRLEVLLMSYSGRSEENARKAKKMLFGVQNSRKARVGGLAGLLDPALMETKRQFQRKLQGIAQTDSKLADARMSWDRIAAAESTLARIVRKYSLLESGAGFNSELFAIARTLVRAAEELPKPGGERLREFRDSGLDSLKIELFSEEPIYTDYEIVKLADGLTFLCSELGTNHELVQKILAGKSPGERAAELLLKTRVGDVQFRKEIFEGGQKAIEKANDPLLNLAILVDPAARALRKIQDSEIEEVKRQAYAEIARVKFALEGTGTYPDATFTLRLSFGTVKGYQENGKTIPFETNFAGLYERSKDNNNQPPFHLPPRWVEKREKLDLTTPFNFVCTADIIGGNSGSPVVNRDGELVGLIFDGNIQSLVADYAYSDTQGRAVSVHSRGMIEALRKIYDANELADELQNRKK